MFVDSVKMWLEEKNYTIEICMDVARKSEWSSKNAGSYISHNANP